MLYAIVAVIAIILDQVVKYLVETRVVLNAVGDDLVRLIPGVVHVTNVHNIGGAFNVLQGARWLFIVVCIVFVAVVIFVLARGVIKTPLARWMAVFVLAGAIGNCIDRIICGYVVDMFELEFFRFPVFNLADIYITLGAIIFCLCVLLEKPNRADAEPEVDETPAEPLPAALEEKPVRAEKPAYPAYPAPPVVPPDPDDPFAEWEKPSAPGTAPAKARPAVPEKLPPEPTPPADESAVLPVLRSIAPEDDTAAADTPDTSDLVWKDDEPAKEEAPPLPIWPVLRGANSASVADGEDVKPFKLHILPEARTAPAQPREEEPRPIVLPKIVPARAPETANPPAPNPAAPVGDGLRTSRPAPAKPAEKRTVEDAGPVAGDGLRTSRPAAKPAADAEPENVSYNIDDILAEFLDS